MKLKEVIVPTANEIEAYQEGKLSERKRILEIIEKVLVEDYKTTLKQFKIKLKQAITKQEKTA